MKSDPGESGSQKPGRIPIIVTDFTLGFGGARTSYLDLIGTLDKSRFEVIALIRDRNFPIPAIEGVRFLRFPYLLQFEVAVRLRKHGLLPSKIWTGISFPVHMLCFFLPYSLYLGIILARNKIRLVHINNDLATNIPILILGRMLGAKIIAHQREYPFPTPTIGTLISRKLMNRHIAVSVSIETALRKIGVSPPKISVIYNSMDLSKTRQQGEDGALPEFGPDRMNLGIFGRVVEWKGQFQVLQAVEALVKTHPGLRLYIVGDASDDTCEYLNRCKDYCAEKGLSQWVVFSGYTKTPFAFMKRMHIIIHNSISPEPFGRVLVEGMSLKKLVMASNLGGPPEIIEDGVNGYLVDAKNPREIAAKLAFLMDNFASLDAVRDAAYATVEANFNLFSQVRKIEALYLSLLEPPSAPA